MLVPNAGLIPWRPQLWPREAFAFSAFFLGLVLLFPSCDFGGQHTQNFADCLDCHQGIESAGTGHDFPCGDCHLHTKEQQAQLEDHSRVLSNPGAPGRYQVVCAACHQQEVTDFQSSLHVTLAGMVNQTRFLFGAQTRAYPPEYGVDGVLPQLPAPKAHPVNPAELVDDLLRRRCLSCHVNARQSNSQPPYRGQGCPACHVRYAQDGRYHGLDPCLDREAKGRPAKHGLTASIPDQTCLTCHRANYTGADAHGWFERDYDAFFQEALLEGRPAREGQGYGSHALSRDLHIERGMGCRDCHSRKAVMGDGRLRGFALEASQVSCEDCHGGFQHPEPNTSLDRIFSSANGQWWLKTRNKAKRRLRLFKAASFAHAPVHAELRCSACHAQWSYQDYGLDLVRQDCPGFKAWTYLTAQGGPGIEADLQRLVEKPGLIPESRDFFSGENKTGIWLKGYGLRRWEYLPLGRDHQGRISVFRPRNQYLVSYVDGQGRTLLDSRIPTRGNGLGRGWAFMPTVPHTTAPTGRSCESCHLNPVAAGLGLFPEVGKADHLESDLELTRPWPPVIPPMRLLTPDEQHRLLQPSRRFRERFYQQKNIHNLSLSALPLDRARMKLR